MNNETNSTGVDRGTLASISVAGVFCFTSILLSTHLVFRHMKHWIEPVGQSHIVRIVLMVPVYALCSWLSLLLAPYTVYFNLVRDCYEAFVLYQFFALLVHYFNTTMGAALDEQNDAVTARFLEQFPARYHPFPCCCLPAIRPGPAFLLTTKRCILQYVLVKPLAALLCMVLQLVGLYDEGSTRFDRGYVWITLLLNVSVALSLYALVIFYETIVHVIEREYQPLYKLLTIKLLLFFIFWQTLVIDALYYFQVVPSFLTVAKHDILNNSLVCAEMFLLSVANLWIYRYETYRDGTNQLGECSQNCWDRIVLPRDVYRDTREVFLL
jgi:hypothetical protein